MKTKAISILFFATILCMSPQLLLAKGGGSGAGMGGSQGRGMGMAGSNQLAQNKEQRTSTIDENAKRTQLLSLKNFLELDDTQLQAIIDTLQKIKNMSDADKAALKSKIAEYEQLSPETQQFIRQGWGRANPDDHQAWQQMMASMSDEERQEIQDKIRSLPFDEKTAFRLQKIEEWKASSKK